MEKNVTEDLDIESKFFIKTPYDSDDPDFNWHKTFTSTDDDDEVASKKGFDKTPLKGDAQKSKKYRKISQSTVVSRRSDNDMKVSPQFTSFTSRFNCSQVRFPRVFKMEKNVTEDLDIESKFFIKTPYDSDDPDFNWHKTFTSTDDDDEVASKKGFDKTPLKGDAQKSKKYRKISQSTVVSRRSDNDMKVSPQFTSFTSRFNCSQGTSSNSTDRWKTPQKRLNRTFPLDTLKELPHNNFALSLSPQCINEVLPVYRGFQLIGDSQLLRFSEQLLPYKNCISSYNSGSTPRRLSYCVSGQKIEEIELLLRKKEYPIGKKVILLIGTNDFLNNTLVEHMYRAYNSLVKFLKENTEHLVLLTVPPVPKLAGHADHWIKLKRFNDMIFRYAKDKKVYVFNSASLYISYNNTVNLDLFEETFNNYGRPDLIHVNKIGFTLLKTLLDIYLEKYKLV
ncbi:hypothetical protein FQR65_LT10836 [Abscondita terminalis]|nr:hypothetical protein FQR65_LT10836 [Abscondita terminalis]